jgi:hypothetical protein
MATYGRGQMLGSGINPESFKQDYSGFARAAETQAQGMANLGASIGGVIKDFGEAKEQRKKIDAETKASRAGIESAIKLGKSLGFDVKGMLSPVLSQMDDPNTTPMEAAALGREASSQIANVLNLGFKAQDQKLEKARLSQDAAYKNEQLKISLQNADSRAKAAIAAGGSAPSTVDMPLGDGSFKKAQWDKEKQSYVPIQVSGFGEKSTSSLGNLPDALKPYAKDFETAGAKYGVAPSILAAISMHETGNGTSSAFRNKNNAMGISNASGPVEVGSVAESIDKMARLLGKGINEGTGPYANAKSIADIGNIYAPPGAGNDPRNLNQFWTQGVTSNIQKLSENKAEQVETTTQNQGRIGFTPAKPEEPITTSRIVTGQEAEQLGGDPNKKYIIKEVGESVTDMAVVPPDITPAEERERQKVEDEKAQTKRAGEVAVKAINKFIDEEGNYNEALDKAVGYGEEFATGAAKVIPFLGTQSPKERADQKDLAILVEKGILEAASLLKPVSNVDLQLLKANRPQMTDPPELWAGWLKEVRGILGNPNSYKANETTPNQEVTIEDELNNLIIEGSQ